MSDYPTTVELRKIARWSHKDFRGLLEYVRSIWSYPDRFVMTRRSLYLSTGGWSGNESVIDALQRNGIFWGLCWKRSERGGHFWFDLTRMLK